MTVWAASELHSVDFKDVRLSKRLFRLVDDLAAHPTASIPEACGSWTATKGAYRFLDSKRVTPAAIRAAHRGEMHLDPAVAKRLMQTLRAPKAQGPVPVSRAVACIRSIPLPVPAWR